MNEKIPIFSEYRTNKNTFHKRKQPIDINKIEIKIINIIL